MKKINIIPKKEKGNIIHEILFAIGCLSVFIGMLFIRFKLPPLVSILLTIIFMIFSIYFIFINTKEVSNLITNIVCIMIIGGILLFLSYVFDFQRTHYTYYGIVIIFLISFILSLIISLCYRKKSKAKRICITLVLTLLIAPMVSAVNTSFNVQEVKTIRTKVIDTKIKSHKNKKSYYIYVSRKEISSFNNKFDCTKNFYTLHSKGLNVSLTYKKGLLGLQYAELDK